MGSRSCDNQAKEHQMSNKCGLSTPNNYFVKVLCPCDERCSFLNDFGKDLELREKTVLGYLAELLFDHVFIKSINQSINGIVCFIDKIITCSFETNICVQQTPRPAIRRFSMAGKGKGLTKQHAGCVAWGLGFMQLPN